MANSRVASQAGSYKLESFKIRPINPLNLTEFAKIGDGVELSQIITQWSFSESMSMANITGSVTVFDAEGVIRTLPIIGEEYITIQWVDFYGDKQTKKFFCYGVEEVAPADDVAENILSYRLNFTSIEHLKAHQEDVRQSFADQLISDMVQSVFDTYYYSNDKTIEIEPTVGMQTYAIPSLTPAATMLFLARKAYGGEDSTNNFRFFETKDKFFFCTPEYLKNKYKDTIKTEKAIEDNNLLFFTNKSYDDNTPAGQLRAQQTVSGINYGSPVNTLNEISGGHYKTSMLEIDLLNHTVERTTTEFKKIITNNKIDDIKIPHSDKFLNEQMPIIDEVYALKDYPVQGQERGVNRHYPFYREVINSKKLFNISMSKYSINCTIRGRNPLIPGMVIFLIVDLVEVGDKKTPDAERNGLYMVTDVTNLFLEDEFTQLVSLTKGGLSSSNDRSLFRGMR
jgi:hypothetical protein